MPQTAKKALKVTTEIDIHAVSCPGVWLPGRGRCSLSLCLLGFHTRTNKLPPVFPLLYHEKFKFERTFLGVRNLSVLERVLEAETVYLELVQEEPSGETVLAVFESSVRDLLFPKPAERLSYSGVDLDLLMEPTRDFPGIISPKIEVSTRTSVSETRTPLHQCSQDTVSFGHAHNKNTKAVFRANSPDEGRKGEGAGGATGASSPEEESAPAHRSPRRGETSVRTVGGGGGGGGGGGSGGGGGGGSGGGGGGRDDGHKPRFVYRKADDDLLSRLPPSSPSRNTRYLGIPSRYLSRSAGNLSDLPRTAITSRYGSQRSGRGLARAASEADGGRRGVGTGEEGSIYIHPRRRGREDLGHRAHVTVLDPERCPHCDEEHGAESCTTCRTYHRYFPRPSYRRPHAHSHAYHTNRPHSALKVLRQPAAREMRPRKRYLAEIEGTLQGEGDNQNSRRARSLSPQRRPTSAPMNHRDTSPPRSPPRGRPNREAEEELSDEEEEAESRSPSRSPSPPASHASAPAAMTRPRPRSYRRPLTPNASRHRYYDSDEDSADDLYVPPSCGLCHLGDRWWCSMCSSHCGCSCTYHLRCRPSSFCHSIQPYVKSYLRRLRELDAATAEPLSPRPKSAKPLTNGAAKGQDTTSEDSELFDTSQVEDIQEGMDSKTPMTKRENWLKGKKQARGGSVEANGANGTGSQDKDGKNNANSS